MSSSKKNKSPSKQNNNNNNVNTNEFNTNDKSMNVSILLHSKGQQPHSSDKVLMCLKDIKQLSIKPGSYVIITIDNNKSICCRCWPSKTLTTGIISLNRIWYPNFPTSSTKRSGIVSSLINSYRIINAIKIDLKCYNKDNEEYNNNLLTSTIFIEYVKQLIENIPLDSNLIFGISWKGKALMIGINDIKVNDNDKIMIQNLNDLYFRYIITDKTIISFLLHDDDNDIKNNKEYLTPLKNNDIETDTLEISSPLSSSSSLLSWQDGFNFGGYSEQVKEASTLLNFALNFDYDQLNNPDLTMLMKEILKPPKGILLHGPPGTGKTRLTKKLVKALKCNVIEISSEIILKQYIGEAERELRNIFQQAQKLAPCCVLIDDAHIICRKRSLGSDLQQRLVSCLLTLIDGVMESKNLFIIATSSRPDDIDEAMRRPGRLDKEIEIGVPSAVERNEILLTLMKEMNINVYEDNSVLNQEEVADQIARISHGMVGSDLLQVLKESHFLALMRTVSHPSTETSDLVESMDKLSITDNNPQFKEVDRYDNGILERLKKVNKQMNIELKIERLDVLTALSKVNPSALRDIVVEVPCVKWTDIGGMDSVKESIRQVVEWPLLYPHLFEKLDVQPPKGILLYGPPGCSKTMMAKALATESSMNFLAVRGPELMSKWLGESEKAIQSLFRKARMASPSIIFFDEIDSLAGKRGESSSGVNDRILSQLLTEIDGIQGLHKVIVVAATNRPDMLDSALIRPGRIDRKIYVPPPDDLSREQIIAKELKKMPTSSDIVLSILIDKTRGFSGAEVVACVSEAALIAIEKDSDLIYHDHLLTAIDGIKPQITSSMLSFYDRLKAQYSYNGR